MTICSTAKPDTNRSSEGAAQADLNVMLVASDVAVAGCALRPARAVDVGALARLATGVSTYSCERGLFLATQRVRDVEYLRREEACARDNPLPRAHGG